MHVSICTCIHICVYTYIGICRLGLYWAQGVYGIQAWFRAWFVQHERLAASSSYGALLSVQGEGLRALGIGVQGFGS